MRQKTLLIVLITVLLGSRAGLPLLGQGQDPADDAGQPAAQSFAGLPLRQQMFQVQVALSRVLTDVGEESLLAETIQSIEESQRRIIEAKLATPPRFCDLDEAAQLKHDRAFRAMLARVLAELAQLESAVLEGSEDRARASLAKLGQLQKEGHTRFQEARGPRDEQPEIKLEDSIGLISGLRKMYVGVYEFAGIGFRVRVVERDGALFFETFGQDIQRLYSIGEHRFQIAIAVGAELRFEVNDAGVAQAIIFDPGGGRTQRVGRVR